MGAERLEKVREISRQMSQNATFAGYDHARRVTQVALDIGRKEGADLDALEVAGLLHDVGVPLDKPHHYEIGAFLVRGILTELGYERDFVEKVARMVETHSRYGGPEPESLEEKILQDADAVEYVGAVGLARGIVRGMENGSYAGNVDELPALIDGLIDRVSEGIHTDRARDLVAGRIGFLREFKVRLEKELRGEA